VHRLPHSYAAAVDRRDRGALSGLFLPDAELSVVRGRGEPRRYRGREEIGGVLDELAGLERTLHAVLAQEAVFEDDGARGEVAMCAHHLRRGEGRDGEDLVIYGRYLDSYGVGEDGRWRFAARRLEVGWTERRPVRLPT